MHQVRMVEQLEAAGFRLAHNELTWSNDPLHDRSNGPDLNEMSFVNKNWVGALDMLRDGCWATAEGDGEAGL